MLVALSGALLALRRVFPLTAFWAIMAACVAAYYGDNRATLVTFLTVAFATPPERTLVNGSGRG